MKVRGRTVASNPQHSLTDIIKPPEEKPGLFYAKLVLNRRKNCGIRGIKGGDFMRYVIKETLCGQVRGADTQKGYFHFQNIPYAKAER